MKKILVFLFMLFASITIISCDKTATETTVTNSTTQQTTVTTQITVPTTQTTVLTDPLTTAASVTGIELTSQSTTFFGLNEEFDKSTLVITASLDDGNSRVLGNDEYQVRGFDSTSAGEKTLFVIYQSFLVEVTVIILEDFAFEINMEYYEDAINLQGDSLKIALNNIINTGFTGKLYGDARDILQESDEDPENPDNVLLVYTGYSVVSTWDGGATWNREHVWPQSRLGVGVDYYNDFVSKATDLHNLKPADPDENSLRSNDYFSTESGADLYEPRDEVKGDIARIILYMATMYFDLTLNDDESTSSALKTMGCLSMLLAWNELDPVDDFERNRNEVIYSYQGNRNPYIDYPQFAELIWGSVA